MTEREKGGKAAELTKDVANLAVASAAAMTAGGPKAAAIAAVSGTVAIVLKNSVDIVAKRRGVLAERFVEHLLLSFDEKTPDEVTALLAEKIEEPYVSETLFESVRRLVDTPHLCVAEALAGLAGDYIKKQKEPDAFFRGAARLLSELSRDEFESLKKLVSMASAATVRVPGASVLELHWLPTVGDERHTIRLETSPATGGAQHMDLGQMHCAPRLFHLLKMHGLGRDNPSGFADTIAGPQVVLVEIEMVARLRTVLRG